jgi:hypothetical protein
MLATKLILSVTRETVGVDGLNFMFDNMLSKEIFYNESSSLTESFTYNRLSRVNFKERELAVATLNNIEGMIEFAPNSEAVKNAYVALGHFVRAFKFFEFTMRVGDIPYSEAINGNSDIYYPKFDTQKEVFLGILDELDKADQLFAAATNFDGDIVYGGQCAQWRKAANVLQLKILINLFRKGDDADLKVKQRFQTIVGSRPVFASNADNFQVVYSDKTGQRYPFYKDGNQGANGWTFSSSIVIDMLKLFEDRRLFYYARPTPASINASLSHTDPDAYRGVNPADVRTTVTEAIVNNEVSLLNERYIEQPAGEPSFLLSYAEMNFILAEAVVRGLLAGDAKVYYEAGVRAAMNFTADHTPDDSRFHHDMKITDDYIATYLAGSHVAFATAPAEQIRQIIQQKYLANFLQEPYHSYFEYRRTGHPALPINPATNQNNPSDRMPMRWLYPQVEYDYNGDNVKAAVDRQYGGTDDTNGIMWILKD